MQTVHPSLSVGPWQPCHRVIGTVVPEILAGGPCLLPVRDELRIALALEDLQERCALPRAALRMEMHDPIAFEHHGVTTFVGLGVALLGTPWVTELRPAMQHLGERGEVLLGVLDEAAVAVDDQLPQPAVGVELGDLADLLHTDRAIGQMPSHVRQLPQGPHRLQPSLGLHRRCVRQRRRPAPHRRMTVSSVVSGRVGSIQHREVRGLERAARELQVDERPIEVGAAQVGHLPRRRNPLQIHTPNDRERVSQSCPDA